MKYKPDPWLLGSFALALVLLVGAVVMNLRSVTRTQAVAARVAHTHQVRYELKELLAHLLDVETGKRGFVITGTPEFLEPYHAALGQVTNALSLLRKLAADNPQQQRSLDTLTTLTQRQLDHATLVVQLRREAGPAAAQDEIASGRGKVEMDAVRAQIARMDDVEEELLVRRETEAGIETEAAHVRMLVASALSVGPFLGAFVLMFRENRLRLRAYYQLREIQESLAVTLHSIGDGVLATDARGRITRLNAVAEQLTGWTQAEAVGRPVGEVFVIINETKRFPATIPVADTLAKGTIQGLANHKLLIARDGTERPIADSCAPIRNDAGEVIGTVLVFRDVSQERKAQRRLAEVTRRYELVLGSMAGGLHQVNLDGTIGYENPAAEKMFGYEPGEMIGRPAHATIHHHHLDGSDYPVEACPIYATLQDGQPRTVKDEVFWRRDGTSFPVDYVVSAIVDDVGQRIGVAVGFRDITVRKQAEAELDRFFEISLELLCIASGDGYFKRVSPAFTRTLGWSREELLARPFLDFVHPGDRAATLAAVEQLVVREEKLLGFENRYAHKDGSWRMLSWNAAPQPGGWMYCAARDVTEASAAVDTLRASEAYNRSIVENSPDCLKLLSLDARLTYMAPRGCRLLEVDDFCAIENTDWLAFWKGDDHAEARRAIEAARAGGHGRFQGFCPTVKGSPRWWDVAISPICGADGQPTKLLCLSRDITESRRMEEAVRASEERYLLVERAVDHGVWDWNLLTHEDYLSPRWKNMLGYREDELPNHESSFFGLLHPDDRELVTEAVRKHLEEGERYAIEMRLRHKDGSYRWVLSRGEAVRDAGGRPVRMVGAITDITERKEAGVEIEWRTRLAEFQAAIGTVIANRRELQPLLQECAQALVTTYDAAFARIWTLNEATQVLELQASAGQYTHLDGPHGRVPVGKFKIGLMASERQPHLTNQVVGDPRVGDQDWAQREGMVAFAGYPLIAEAKVVGVMALFARHTLTDEVIKSLGSFSQTLALGILTRRSEEDLRQALAELSHANAELGQASRHKDEFLANMSHELRTPLNAILGLSEALLEQVSGSLTPRQVKSLTTISTSGQHLLALINDILDLSKIEAGKLDLHREPLNVDEFCQSCLVFVKTQAMAKQIYVDHQQDDQPLVVSADPKRLKQILVNLLTNAVKFTPEGGRIGLQVTRPEGEDVVKFTVWDNGIGIAPGDQDKLFNSFSQIDSGLSRAQEGTGLGLALVAKLVKLHGGSVSLESETEKGSRFIVTLPLGDLAMPLARKPGQAEFLRRVSGGAPGALRAVIIEDDPTAGEMLGRYLSELGVASTLYVRGDEALEVARRTMPDVIFTGIQLPGDSGWVVLTRLKEDPQTRDIPVAVVSIVDEPEKSRALGAAAHFTKPITREQLAEFLRLPCFPKPGSAPRPVPEATPAGGPVILLAEDNAANEQTVGSYLEDKGYTMHYAVNGQEAVKLAAELRPALILMDVQMPVMDGLEATRQIRADAALKDVPIIALTALAMPGDRERCLEAGANDYLSKPVKLKELAKLIAGYLTSTPGVKPNPRNTS